MVHQSRAMQVGGSLEGWNQLTRTGVCESVVSACIRSHESVYEMKAQHELQISID